MIDQAGKESSYNTNTPLPELKDRNTKSTIFSNGIKLKRQNLIPVPLEAAIDLLKDNSKQLAVTPPHNKF